MIAHRNASCVEMMWVDNIASFVAERANKLRRQQADRRLSLGDLSSSAPVVTDKPPMLLHLVCLISISACLCTGQKNTQIPSTNPELIEGPWETTGASGIDGIFLTIETGSS